MGRDEKIKRGGLAGKMAGYSPEPPESVWEGISSQLGRGGNRRLYFMMLAAAAGLALAITVGVTFFTENVHKDFAENAILEGKVEERTAGSVDQDNIKGGVQADSISEGARQLDIAVERSRDILSSDRIAKASDSRPAADLQRADRSPSRLEEKVIIAVDELLKEENERRSLVVSQTTDIPEDVDPAMVDTIRMTNDKVRRSDIPVNEDSLLRLLEPFDLPVIENNTKQQGSWQIGASAAPLYSYRDVSSEDSYQKQLANNSESARLTFAGGVHVSYKSSERLSFESGIIYNRMGVNIGGNNNLFNDWFAERTADYGSSGNRGTISNSIGKIVSGSNNPLLINSGAIESTTDYNVLQPQSSLIDNYAVEVFSQSFEYLEIPFSVKYKVIDRSIGVQLIGGISTNFLLNSSVYAYTGEGSLEIGEVQDIRSLNYSGNAGIGLVYDIFDNLTLSMEPRFRYYLNSINRDYLPVTRPFTFGFYTGFNYNF